MTKQRTKKNMNSELSQLAQRYHLAEVYVFGSRSQEIADVIRKNGPCRKSSSDVDIGIRPLPGFLLSPREIVNVAIELEDLFSVERVDIVVLPQAEPFLALDIIRGELLYARDSLDQARYELFVLRRAGDLLPFKKERIEMILGGHKQ
jgi:predicted nucleotidyltransferase